MKTKKPKYAFFSIDVERFIDTECVSNANQPIKQTMLDGLDRYMAILDKYDIKATMFVLSDLADEIYEQLKKHLKNGHKIALHGKHHIAPRMMTNEQFRRHIASAKEKLENLFGTKVVGYRAPCFSIDHEKLDILRELGFQYDSSRMDFAAARHTTHVDMEDFENPIGEVYTRDGFCEFGLTTQRVFGKKYPISGGGYLRIPNWFFAFSLLQHYLKKNDYYIFYSHPFEFSEEKVPRVKKLKFYDKLYLSMGLYTYPYKTEFIIKLLKKFGYTFTTFESQVANMVSGK